MTRRPTLPPDNDDADQGDFLSKSLSATATGTLPNYDSLNLVQGTRIAAGLIPGVGAQVIDPFLAAVEGEMESGRDTAKYQKEYGDLQRLANRSYGFRRKWHELNNRWSDRMGEAAASAGGALAGAAVSNMVIGSALGSIFPGAGTLLGGAIGLASSMPGLLAGSFAANKVYNKTFPQPNQDAMALVKQMKKMLHPGKHSKEPKQYIPPEMVFAVMAANMPDARGKEIEKQLFLATGTKQFDVALADSKNMPALRLLAYHYDNDIRASTNIFPPFTSPIGQFTAWINRGEMSPGDLLDPVSYLMRRREMGLAYPIAPHQPTVAHGVSPASLGVHPLGRNMAGMGVAMAGEHDSKLPLPPGSHTTLGKA